MTRRATISHMKQPDPIPFTKVGYEKMKVRQEELLAKREIVLVSLQRAREMGDLSENGAYTSAKFELGNTDRELRRLAHNLKYGVVTEKKGTESVGFGNTVTVETDGKTYTYLLVGTQESDPMHGTISLESPIGRALLGKKVGDVVVVTMPERVVTYVIRNIS